MTGAGDLFYFVSEYGNRGIELWESDGSAERDGQVRLVPAQM